ncbi:MAG: HAD-IC family P-type ATPase, partial [Myxococcota bacterium]
LVVDRETRDLVSAPDPAFLDACRERVGERVTPEYLQCQVEVGTRPHATVGEAGNGKVLTVKGAPEVVLPKCHRWKTNGDAGPLDDEQRKQLEAEASRLADEGLRILVVAEREVDDERVEHDDIEQLAFRGFLGLSDPVRPAAIQAVDDLRAAGVQVIMITGDHPSTARSIARQLGLAGDDAEELLLGPDIDLMDDEKLDGAMERARVVARATPAQKVRIVEALQRDGRTVAMTGDGANDAPAIRLADVGIALGASSTSAARSAADLIVVDGRIETIVSAIVEGRAMWSSVRDAVAILIGGNLGEIAYTVASGVLTTDSPLNARQLMLVNLLTDVAPSMAVAVQPPEDGASESLLEKGPSAALGKTLTHEILWRATITSSAAFAAWASARLLDRKRASTVGLLALVGSQLGQTVAVGRRDKGVLKASLGSAAVLLAMVQTPAVSRLVGCQPVGPLGLLTATGASVASGLLARHSPGRIPYLESYLEKVICEAEGKASEGGFG